VATSPKVSENPTVQRHYLAQLALSVALTRALQQLWASNAPTAGAQGFRSFRAGLQAVVAQFSLAAASQSRDYYLNVRQDAGVPGVPRVPQIAPPPSSLIDAGLEWAMRAQEFTDDVEARILARVEAAMQKAVMDVSREQVVAAVAGDDRALGFRRVPRADACAFCLTLAMRRSTRGETDDQHLGVYKTRASAGQIPPDALGDTNRYHNNCHCSVQPVFGIGDLDLPDWMPAMQRLYEQATADSKSGDRLNDFRRTLAAIRRGEEPPSPLAPAGALAVSLDARLGLLSDLLANLDA